LPDLPTTTDPKTYAQAVATALFGWDTASGLTPLDYSAVLLAGADPSGAEANGLASDLRTYLPTQDAWVGLRQYQTKQWLTIDTTVVPDAWAEALAQATPGQILPGTTAYTITGTRHRSGVWNNEAVTSAHPVSFTVFVACRPSFPACHVLRLSQLDNPLH